MSISTSTSTSHHSKSHLYATSSPVASPSNPPTTTSQPTASSSKSRVRHVPWTEHTLRQLKLVIPGAAITYYLGTLDDFWKILQGFGGSWAQSVFFLLFSTTTLFSYISFSSFCHSFFIIPSLHSRLAGLGASGLGFITVTLFLYVLLMPWITGEEPNVCRHLDSISPTRSLNPSPSPIY